MNKKDFFNFDKPIKDQVLSGLKLLYQIPMKLIILLGKYLWHVIYYFRRVIILFLSFFVLLVIIIPGFLSIFFGSSPELDDVDMYPEKIDIPLESDGYQIIIADDCAEDPLCLADKEPDLEVFDAVVEKDFIVNPVMRDFDFSYQEPSSLTYCRELAELANERALELIEQKDYKEAREEIMKLIKFGHMLSVDKGAVHYFAGLKIKDEGIALYGNLLQETYIDKAVLKKDLETLETYDTPDASLLIKLSYLDAKYWMNYLREDMKWGNSLWLDWPIWNDFISFYLRNSDFYFNLNETLNGIAGEDRLAIQYVDSPCTELKLDFSQPLYNKSFFDIVKMYFTKNSLGKSMFENAIWDGRSSNKTKQYKCGDQSMLNALKIKIATKLYFQDKKRYPETLNELIPNYLKEIPVDVYTGEAPKYNYEKKVLDIEIPQGNLLFKIDESVYDLNF